MALWLLTLSNRLSSATVVIISNIYLISSVTVAAWQLLVVGAPSSDRPVHYQFVGLSLLTLNIQLKQGVRQSGQHAGQHAVRHVVEVYVQGVGPPRNGRL